MILKRLNFLLQSRRLWGLAGTAVGLYFLVFVVLGRLDVSWLMPPTNQIAQAIIDVWPRLPFFAVQRVSVDGGKGTEIYYTVPTHQLTQKEMMQMGLTNTTTHPAVPK
jgi:hypothetical protein